MDRMSLPLPSRADIVARLASHPPLESLMTADDLERQHRIGEAPLKPAAVLLLIVEHPRPTVVFTQRTAHLSDHAGQISFPGGRCDAGDCDPEHTALREAHEEVGIEPARVELLGRLPEYRTSTGFSVTPVVGLVAAADALPSGSARGRRCLRGAPRIPPRCAQPPLRKRLLQGPHAQVLGDALRRTLHLGRHRRDAGHLPAHRWGSDSERFIPPWRPRPE
jgi:8-oxo-dGTP pyrophosphatase MutT (NUDIX family)